MNDSIERTIDLEAPIERVWSAVSDHVQFGEWFRVKLEGPFVPGQEARGNILHPGYEHVIWKAMIVAMEEPRLFSFTWHPYGIDPNVDYSVETPTLIEFRLRPTDTGTHLTITESGFYKVPAHRREEAFRMDSMGWEQQIKNIHAHVGG